MSDRIAWVDRARGVGIVLVVVGHTVRGLAAAGVLPPSTELERTDAWIYAFHMPLFFLLAGLFAPRSLDRPTSTFVAEKLRTLAFPYLVWSVLQTSLQIVLAAHTNHPAAPRDLLRIAYEPVMQFWFLYALFVIFLILHGLRRVGLSFGAILSASALLWVGAPAAARVWSVAGSALQFMPYVALGAVAFPWLRGRLAELGLGACVAGTVLGFGAAFAGVLGGLHASHAWSPALALAGTGGALCLASALARTRGTALLARLGEQSMAIYVMHTLASAGARITLVHVLHVESAWVHLVVGVAVGLAVPMAFVALFDRVGFRHAFAWPAVRSEG